MTRRRIVPLVLSLFALGACAGASPTTTGARVTDDVTGSDSSGGSRSEELPQNATTVDRLTAAESARWGDGRAIAAATAPDGTTAVVTTVEVHIVRPDGSVSPIDDEAKARTGLVAISDDAGLVATVSAATGDTPPVISWHDAAGGAPLASAPVESSSLPTGMHFLPGTRTLLIETDRGPAAWPEPPTDGQPPVVAATDAVAGPSALLSGGVAVTPLLGTRSVVVMRNEAMLLVEVDLPENASLQRAISSPDGTVLVVEAAIGDTEFDRPDQLAILDRRRLVVNATIQLGRDVPGGEWTVHDGGPVVAQGNRIDRYDLSGQSIETLTIDGELGVGRIMASAGGLTNVQSDGTISFWPGVSGAPVELLAPGRVIGPVDVASAGVHLTAVDALGRVRTWAGADGTSESDIDAFEIGELTGVAIGADGVVAAGTTVGRVVLADTDLVDAETIVSTEEAVRVDSVAFRPGSAELATGRAERRSDLAFDDTLTLWQLDDRTPRFRSGGEAEDVPGCAFFFHRLRYTPDGELLATASHDFTVGIVDAQSGDELLRLPPRRGSILDLAFTPDGSRLAISADDNTIEVWDTRDWSMIGSLASTSGGYSAVAALPDANAIVVADVTGGLSIIALDTGAPTQVFDGLLPPRPTVVAASADGALVASPLLDDDIGIWSSATGELLATLDGHADDVSGLAFDADGSTLVSASADGTLRSWSLERS